MDLASMDDDAMKNARLEERKRQARRVLKEYEGFVPVYVTRSPKARVENVIRNQYLVATNVPIGIFMYKLKKEIKLKPEEALFIFIGDCIPSNTALIGDLYKTYHNPEDLHLHLSYTDENVYG